MECKVGLMQRPERVVWLGLGSFFCGISSLVIDPGFVWMIGQFPAFRPVYIFTVPIFVVAILSTFTSIQRMVYAYRLSIKLVEQEEKIPGNKIPTQETKTSL